MKPTCRTAEAAVDAAVCFEIAAVLNGRRYAISFDEGERLISPSIDALIPKLAWRTLAPRR